MTLNRMNKVSDAVRALQNAMNEEGVNPQEILPLDLFLFSTTLLPFVNVDLLVLNARNQILLSWRNDVYYGTGWQLPGGVIRMMETIDERIQKTAIREIGCKVSYDPKPVEVYENIVKINRMGLNNQRERAHNIALLYKCRAPEDYVIDNKKKEETDEGFLRWFDVLPEDLLACHKGIRALKAWL